MRSPLATAARTWSKRVDRCLNKLAKTNMQVVIEKRKRIPEVNIFLLHYDCTGSERLQFKHAGRRLASAEQDTASGAWYIPVRYTAGIKPGVGPYGVCWGIQISLNDTAKAIARYSTALPTHEETSIFIGTDPGDEACRVIDKVTRRQWTAMPFAPRSYDCLNKYSTKAKLLNVENPESLVAMLLNPDNDATKIRRIVREHLGLQVPNTFSVLEVNEILELPNIER